MLVDSSTPPLWIQGLKRLVLWTHNLALLEDQGLWIQTSVFHLSYAKAASVMEAWFRFWDDHSLSSLSVTNGQVDLCETDLLKYCIYQWCFESNYAGTISGALGGSYKGSSIH